MAHDGWVRTLRRALGWLVTIAAGAALLTVLVLAEIAPDLISARLPASDPADNWIGILIVTVLFGGFAAFWLYLLLSPKQREFRRQRRAERDERRRKLENFEL